ncbi:ABC transporter substrate-binding protein [Longispora sp. NPDC051575]|uniref:ABC transporter substrate-binding protein n=1 Tax=Longispora sp. NPDC051575 TaxID=3154943 RepID=UPI003435CD30
MRKVLAVLGTVALMAGIAGCGEKENAAPKADATAKTTVDKALADKVPAAIKADGKISIGVDSTYPPNEYLDADGKTVIGFDVELFNAVAAKLGLKTEWTTSAFDDILPGVQSGKYEAGVSSFTINDERKKNTLMVSYFSAGTQWITAKGNPQKVSPDDACGKKIAVQTGTVQETEDLPKRQAACKAAGKPEIKVSPYQAQADATAAVASGKDDAMLADSPVCVDAVAKTGGKLELQGKIYDSAPYGWVLNKDQQAFAEALRDAHKALVADGTYDTILKKWNVQDGKLPGTSEINPS